MVSDRDLFAASGPLHVTSVNWQCPHYRRSVAASLVQGAYVLERDRQKNRSSEARAPAWWEFFHFKLIRQLVDDADLSIFGAIYEFKPPISFQNSSTTNAPKFVIALRGTITKNKSLSRDLKLDLSFLHYGLHRSSRFEITMQAVQCIVSNAGHLNVWLAGHSLGAALATLAGKKMAMEGIHLDAFLFNPPFFSPPIERIKDKEVKHGIRIASSFIAAGLAVAMKNQRKKSEELFTILSSWVPNLFINPADHVYAEYIGYFDHRKKMVEIGAAGIGRLATQNSIGDLLLNAFGQETDPIHLLPSANLIISTGHSPDFKRAHGIHQWWAKDLTLRFEEHRYN
ncbi:GDSL esterase/lipase [Apostasia shenzhenica]|uniref:GDSL esterase/lipase n=1 Tax=Apostasia shenzhenica TaxID=1088818 RepID=A0A2H9ZR23_9ASPA|nr:GDSL esterase/lipase [Apostasia shenzhenica]